MIQVRQAQAHDEGALFPLVGAFPTPSAIEPGEYSRMFRQKLADPSAFVAVASRDGRLVGYLSGHRHAAFYAGGNTAWVDEIFVVAELRKYGVGRTLMAAFEAWALQGGCALVSLATAGAGDFYGRLGYATKAGYYKKYLKAAAP
jgi:GNAT superfamily N-acetyltransferase